VVSIKYLPDTNVIPSAIKLSQVAQILPEYLHNTNYLFASNNQLQMQGLKINSLGFLSVAKLQLIVTAECSFVLSGDLLVGKPTD